MENRKNPTDTFSREVARRARGQHWAFMEKVSNLGTVWWCIWNKAKKPELSGEHRCCLISGMQLNEWNEKRYARRLRLTDAGRETLKDRHLYGMEPVTGGLVEPGYVVDPLPGASEA